MSYDGPFVAGSKFIMDRHSTKRGLDPGLDPKLDSKLNPKLDPKLDPKFDPKKMYFF